MVKNFESSFCCSLFDIGSVDVAEFVAVVGGDMVKRGVGQEGMGIGGGGETYAGMEMQKQRKSMLKPIIDANS